MKRKLHGFSFMLVAGVVAFPSGSARGEDDSTILAIYADYEKKYEPLHAEVERATWEAYLKGTDAAFAKKRDARLALARLHCDEEVYITLRDSLPNDKLKDPAVARLARIMHNAFLFCKVDREAVEKIIELESYFEQTLQNHRIQVDGADMTTRDVRRLLRTTTDSARAEKAWKAYMKLGKELDPKFRELARYRNVFAERLDDSHYFRLKLKENKFASTPFYRFFNFLNLDMGPSYQEMKREIDAALAAKFGIAVDQLRPWHYGDVFFREAPLTPESNLDQFFQGADIVRTAQDYFEGVGLPCKDIVSRSDFSPAPGSAMRPYHVGYDPSGKVRVACEVERSVEGAENIFQALAKAVYRENMRDDVFRLLRQPSFEIVDEGLGSFFGTMVRNIDYLRKSGRVDPKTAEKVAQIAKRNMKWRSLIRAQWAQLVVRFEVSLYADPTRDLPGVWSEFMNKYQLVPPVEDKDLGYGYALCPELLFQSALHYTTLMGDILAVQLHDFVRESIVERKEPGPTCFMGEEKLGAYLREKIMGPANLLHWERLIRENVGGNFRNDNYLKEICGVENPTRGGKRPTVTPVPES